MAATLVLSEITRPPGVLRTVNVKFKSLEEGTVLVSVQSNGSRSEISLTHIDLSRAESATLECAESLYKHQRGRSPANVHRARAIQGLGRSLAWMYSVASFRPHDGLFLHPHSLDIGVIHELEAWLTEYSDRATLDQIVAVWQEARRVVAITARTWQEAMSAVVVAKHDH